MQILPKNIINIYPFRTCVGHEVYEAVYAWDVMEALLTQNSTLALPYKNYNDH